MRNLFKGFLLMKEKRNEALKEIKKEKKRKKRKIPHPEGIKP